MVVLGLQSPPRRGHLWQFWYHALEAPASLQFETPNLCLPIVPGFKSSSLYLVIHYILAGQLDYYLLVISCDAFMRVTDDIWQNVGIVSANASEPIATIATGSSLALLQRDTATPTRAIQIPSSTGTLATAEASGSNHSKWRLIAMLLQGIGADHPESNYGGWDMWLRNSLHQAKTKKVVIYH